MEYDIWPQNTRIPIIGVTGVWASGKTTFLLSIDPARTLYYDLELSGTSYARDFEAMGLTYVNLAEMAYKKKTKNFSRAIYDCWREHSDGVAQGQYSVIAIDPINELEPGDVQDTLSRYKEFKFKSADTFSNSKGIFWDHARSEWKQKLLKLAAKCQTLAFSTHMKVDWKHGSPTSKKSPKGKTTLFEVSSLYLQLEKDRNTTVPSADVLRSRLMRAKLIDGTPVIKPILPPRLEVASPDMIRRYINEPVDYGELSAEQMVQGSNLSDDDKLELQASIAENKRATAEAERDAKNTEAEIEAVRQKALARVMPPSPTVAPAGEPQEDREPSTQPDATNPVASPATQRESQDAVSSSGSPGPLNEKVLKIIFDRKFPRERVVKYLNATLDDIRKAAYLRTGEEDIDGAVLSLDNAEAMAMKNAIECAT